MRALLTILACAAITACSHYPAAVEEHAESAQSRYLQLTRALTHSERVYRGLDAAAIVHVTYQSDAWRKARVDYEIELYRLTPGEAAERRRIAGEMRKQGIEFMLSLYTPESDDNNLSAPGTAWRLLLEAGEVKVRPQRVKKITTGKRNLREFYPHILPWEEHYLVVFPTHDASGRPVTIEGPEPVGLWLSHPTAEVHVPISEPAAAASDLK